MRKELEYLKTNLIQMFFNKVEALKREPNEENSKLFGENMNNMHDSMLAAANDFNNVDDIRIRLLQSKNLSPKENILLEVLLYLLLAEGVICNFLNFVSYLLVENGHDLFSQTNRGYVKANMKEISKVEMSTKIKFLNHHGFRALTKEYDSTFRNNIAHHNYSIDETGNMWIKEELVDFHSKRKPLENILDFSLATMKEIIKKLDTLDS